MAVYKRANGNWYVQFMYNGKNYIKSAKSKRKADAEALERKMRDDLHKYVVLGEPIEIKIEAAFEQYMESKKDKSVYTTIRAIIRWYAPKVKGLYLHQLTTARFYELIKEKKDEGASPNTLLAYKQALLGANKLAKKLGYKAFECESPEVKRNKHRLRYLSVKEEAKLLNQLDPRYKRKGLADPGERSEDYVRMLQDNYDFVVMLLDTGARLNEIAKLQWKYVDLKQGVIHLWRPKVQNESILKLSDRALDVMERRAKNKLNEYVFTNRNGTTAKVSMMSVRKAFERAGLNDCTIHTLRHTFASRMIQNGASLYEVKELLGHSSINTTMVYSHLCQDKTTSKAKEIMDRTNRDVQRARLRLVG